MGTLSQELAKEGHSFLCPISHTQNSHKMVDNVETTTPTVEEVATNGESETATEEVTAAATENGTNGVHKETTEEKTEEKNGEATNGAEALRRPKRLLTRPPRGKLMSPQRMRPLRK